MAAQEPTDLEAALRRLVEDLRGAAVSFALVGGLAISIRAEPRLTRDIDVAVSVGGDAQAEAIVHQLIQRGYHPETVLEQELTGRLATVRLVHRDRPDIVVDLLFASCGIEPEIVGRSQNLEALPGLVLPVARAGHLIAMKLLARDDRRRPADADDLRALAAVADQSDWSLAREAVHLITERGYHRGRDLAADLAELRG